jgi:hypothetical protein
MPTRPDRDTVTIESVQGGEFSILVDKSTQYEIVTDMTAPSLARFELGDEGTWSVIRDAIGIGRRFKVSVNGRPRVTGRLLTRNLAVSIDASATVQVVVRTRLADAMFTACDPKVGVRNTTIKDLVLAAYKRMGLTEDDFVFRGDVARDLLTGRKSGQPSPAAAIRYRMAQARKIEDAVVRDVELSVLERQLKSAESRPALPDLTTLREDEARPHPPESIFAFVERHLNRHGLMHWDGPNGKLIVGAPDDSQGPIYVMTARRGEAGRTNNLLSATKCEDYEEVPAQLWVFGVGGGRDQAKARVKFCEIDPTLAAASPFLDRSAIIVDESIQTQALAEARARREMTRRSMMKDSWTLETDGFSYWDGSNVIPYVIDTVADVHVDVAGGASGAYLVHRVTMRGSADSAHTTELQAVGRGIWRL